MQANRDIADHLWRIGEYNTYHEALHALNQKTREYMNV